MNKKKDAWKSFQKTGTIDDYMAYKSAKEKTDSLKKTDEDGGKRV